LELAASLIPGAAGFKNVTPSAQYCPEFLLRLYEETSGKGYVAYIVTPGEYVPVANEGLVHINMDGDIEAINHLTWIVGHGVSAEGFADKFVGKDNWHIENVELISGATVTAGDFRTAVQDAVEVVTKMITRTDKKLLELVDEIVPISGNFELLEIPEGAPSTLKRIYKDTTGRGYVAFVRTEGWGGEVGTEALVYVDTLGTIKNVKLLVWNVGHGVSGDDFAKSFIGMNKDTIDEVELISGATGTSEAFKNSIATALPYIPTHFPTARVIGIIVLAISVCAAVFFVILYKKRRTVKK
jgi:major membrane immunogen (membrane-anchored lipoprotein)